jgi:serine/threonine protein kinase
VERPLGSKYILESALGHGATGEVWRGRTTDGQELAFKVLHDGLARDHETVRRFIQEASLLVGVNHPNLVQVHDLVVEGETLAIVMDLVTGGDLRDLLGQYRVLPPAEVCRIGAEMAAGLSAVHAAGVVHRDLKPENLLLDGRISPPRPRLTDFGIARIAEQTGSGRSTMLVGTPQYVAPEVFDGQAPTPAADLYALGIVLYEMCCGTTPFAGGSTLSVLRRHVECAPGRPAGIPDPLWELIAALLVKHPAARPAPAARVAHLLTALAADLAAVPPAPALTEPPPAVPLISVQATQSALPAPPRGDATVAGGPPPRRGRRRALLTVAAVLVLLAAGGGGYAALRSSGGSPSSQNVAGPGSSSTAGAAVPAPAASSTPTYRADQMPNLVGMSLGQAKAAVPAGVDLQVVEAAAPSGTPDGVVTAQDPAPGAALPKSAALTVATSNAIQYLTDLTPTSGQFSESGNSATTLSLSGHTQLYAVGVDGGGCGTTTGDIQYDLGSHFTTLSGLAGIDDTSPSATAQATVEFFGDSRKLASYSVSLGHPKQLKVTVTGVLRLDIRWTFSGLAANGCDRATMVLGAAQLTAAAGYNPQPSPTPSG